MRVPAPLQSPGMAATRPGWARGEAERCPKQLPRLGQGSDCLTGERQGKGFLVPEVSRGQFPAQPEVSRGLRDLGSWGGGWSAEGESVLPGQDGWCG